MKLFRGGLGLVLVLGFGFHPEGPDTQLLRTEAPKAIMIMAFQPKILNNKVPGPSGFHVV